MIERINAPFSAFYRNKTYQYLLLALVTLVAALLRFYKLGEWSFWIDEMITFNNAQKSLGLIFRSFTGHPITTSLIGASLFFFGLNEWSARLVPALIGILSVPVLYFPIRKIFGPAVALVAGLLLAISPWHLYWSQNARFYPLLLLFYTLALLAFYFGLEEDRPWYLLLSLLLLGLATTERLLGLFFIPVIGCYLVLVIILPIEKPAGLRPRNLALIIAPILIIALIGAAEFIIHPGRWLAIFGDRETANPLTILSWFIQLYVRVPIICMGALGALYLLVQKRRIGLFLSISIGVPLATILLASLFQFADPRYAFGSLTSWIILASVAVVTLFSEARGNVKILAVGIMVFLLLDPIQQARVYYNYTNGDRVDWKSAFALVEEQRKPGDLVVSNKPSIGTYYLGEEIIGTDVVNPDGVIRDGKTVWFVLKRNMVRVDPTLEKWIEENTRLVHDHFNILVYLYDPTPAESQVSSSKSQDLR